MARGYPAASSPHPPYTPAVTEDTRPYVVITADTHAGARDRRLPRVPRPGASAPTSTLGGAATGTRRRSTSAARRPRTGTRPSGCADLAERRRRRRGDLPEHRPALLRHRRSTSRRRRARSSTGAARAGTRAHNRWLAEFCAEAPARRAGIGLIHLNDIDDAIEDVAWIAKNGLRGGVLLPLPSPSDVHLKPLNHPDYDRLWAAIQDCGLVVNQHSGQGSPTLLRAARARRRSGRWRCRSSCSAASRTSSWAASSSAFRSYATS